MQPSQAGKCSNCGSRDTALQAVYDWRRTEIDGGWVWLGTPRMLCAGCRADPRFVGRWIDERQKPTAQKPAWAESEPEEFARALPPEPPVPPAAAPAKQEVPAKPEEAGAPARRGVTTVRGKKRKKAPRGRGK